MTTISATTVLRSRNALAPEKVLTTLLLRYPRWIHAEFMTHRVFSRNSASSRAIPVSKLIEDVIQDPAMPIYWGKNQKGMQAFEECNNPVLVWSPDDEDYVEMSREEAWLHARNDAVEIARRFADAGYHKQVVNRFLEPFAHITVVASSTEWDNFLRLRDHKDAEPHIQMLAREIRRCLENDPMQVLQPGEWHLPFVTKEDEEKIVEMLGVHSNPDRVDDYKIKLSIARCASTSYKTVDGFVMSIERSEQIFEKLIESDPEHASPAEHVAMADDVLMHGPYRLGWQNPNEHGNFEGFRQFRHMYLEGILR